MNDWEDSDDEGNIYADSVPKKRRSSKPEKKSNWLIWVLALVGGGGLMMCICCGGFMYFSVSVLNQAIIDGYQNHELVQEHIGTISSCTPNLEATGDQEGMVFDVVGDKGSGQIIVDQQQGERFGKGELRVNGQTFELGPSM